MAYLEGQARLTAFAVARVFVLPSFSEGSSIAVLEALAARLPVLLSPQCNFPEAVRAGAAVEAGPMVEETEGASENCWAYPMKNVRRRGMKGRRLVEKAYRWNGIAPQMLAICNWLMRKEARPPSVVSD
jgi:poly(glycerol-phosphate) alpha-glucosyltransferase